MIQGGIDWSGIRAAAVAVGVSEAARQAGRDLPPIERERFRERVCKRAVREGWLSKVQAASQVASSPSTGLSKQGGPLPLSKNVQTGQNALESTLTDRKEKTKLHLSRYVVEASKNASRARGRLGLAPRVKEVAQIAAHVWPEAQAGSGPTLNILSIAGDMNVNHSQ